jgi:regulator of CtrA degradation
VRRMVRELSSLEDGTVSFAEKLAASDSFKALFREGMVLVEEAASYLDGEGRDEAKRLPRMTALAYAAESMRLTTRLMQLASWLLLQRAVNEGELTSAEALTEKRKVRLVEQDVVSNPETLIKLPARLLELIESSIRLQARIIHIDRLLYQPQEQKEPIAPVPRPLETQLQLLRASFETV